MFTFFLRFNSKTTGPIFTKFLHNVEELVPLLMRAFTNDIAFYLGTPDQRVKAVNFDVRTKGPKLIGYHSNIP